MSENLSQDLIEKLASNPDVSLEKLEAILSMQENQVNKDNVAAFNKAFSALQCELPEIEEKTKGHNYKYAAFEDINRIVKPILKKHGFALSFRTDHKEKEVAVTAILMHESGHNEQTTIMLPHENSGSKNGVQAVGSTVSYGKRYTMLSILNISTCGEDTDGVGDMFISEDLVLDLQERLAEVDADIKAFCKHMKVNSLAQIKNSDYAKALNLINAKKERANANS